MNYKYQVKQKAYSLLSINYHDCCSLIGCAAHNLFCYRESAAQHCAVVVEKQASCLGEIKIDLLSFHLLNFKTVYHREPSGSYKKYFCLLTAGVLWEARWPHG